MLYVARCIKCNHLLKSADVTLIKQLMASHSWRSHKSSYGCFVAHLRLSDFEDFQIWRIRNPADIRALNRDWKSPHYWFIVRNINKLAKAMQ